VNGELAFNESNDILYYGEGGNDTASTTVVKIGGAGAFLTTDTNQTPTGVKTFSTTTLSITGGTNGNILSTNGSGALTWISTTGTGSVVLSAGPTFTGTVNAANITLSGNLVVNGTTTTVNSTTVTLDDPIITLGGDVAPTTNDNKDRGVEFRWHNGSTARLGFFGFDDSTGYFTFISDATNSSEVFSGTLGDIQAANFRGNLVTDNTTIDCGTF
jgi:hypothetical protein